MAGAGVDLWADMVSILSVMVVSATHVPVTLTMASQRGAQRGLPGSVSPRFVKKRVDCGEPWEGHHSPLWLLPVCFPGARSPALPSHGWDGAQQIPGESHHAAFLLQSPKWRHSVRRGA